MNLKCFIALMALLLIVLGCATGYSTVKLRIPVQKLNSDCLLVTVESFEMEVPFTDKFIEDFGDLPKEDLKYVTQKENEIYARGINVDERYRIDNNPVELKEDANGFWVLLKNLKLQVAEPVKEEIEGLNKKYKKDPARTMDAETAIYKASLLRCIIETLSTEAHKETVRNDFFDYLKGHDYVAYEEISGYQGLLKFPKGFLRVMECSPPLATSK